MEFWKIFTFYVCINVGFTIIGLNLPTLGFTLTENPFIYNSTQPTNSSYLVGNLTQGSGSSNGTSFLSLDWFTDSVKRILFYVQVPFEFIGLAFPFLVMGTMATSIGITWPIGFIGGISTLLGLSFVAWIIYMITGRAQSGAN